ncbi:MAG: hypothetical protein P8L20_08990 [Flavobacteriales bacterium]|nr:hypothetical protein [Flavobacteriales bacterium]
MIKVYTPEQADPEHHRLTPNELRKFENLSEEIIFDLSNEEFESMMKQVDSSACLEPLFFSISTAELEPSSIGYY